MDNGCVEVIVKISLEKNEGETDMEAYRRLYESLDYNLCNNPELMLSYQTYSGK